MSSGFRQCDRKEDGFQNQQNEGYDGRRGIDIELPPISQVCLELKRV